MKKELLDKWVNALESGEYTQGKWSLCGGGGYCCLGVLIDVSDEYSLEPAEGEEEYQLDEISLVINDSDEHEFIDEGRCHVLGLPLGMSREFAKMNDGGADFKTIAARIREEVPVTGG